MRVLIILVYLKVISNYCIVGDFNANISNPDSYFSNTLIKYCADNNNIMSDKSLLDSDRYTCVSSAWKTCLWLDHLLSTFDMHSSILDIRIDYSFILSDHHSLVFIINQNTIPSSIIYNNSIIHKKNQWNRLDKKQILKYNIDIKFNLKFTPKIN